MTDTHLMASFPAQAAQASTRKVKPFWIAMKQEKTGWQWHQLDYMQIICTSLQTDNQCQHLHLIFYRPDALPDAQRTASKQ